VDSVGEKVLQMVAFGTFSSEHPSDQVMLPIASEAWEPVF